MRSAGRCAGHCSTRSKSVYFLLDFARTPATANVGSTMLECWPHVYHVKITFGILQTNQLDSTKTNSMKCLVNLILLRRFVHSRNT